MTKSMIRNPKSFADLENVRIITLNESLYLVSLASLISRKILIVFDIFRLIVAIKAVKHFPKMSHTFELFSLVTRVLIQFLPASITKYVHFYEGFGPVRLGIWLN